MDDTQKRFHAGLNTSMSDSFRQISTIFKSHLKGAEVCFKTSLWSHRFVLIIRDLSKGIYSLDPSVSIISSTSSFSETVYTFEITPNHLHRINHLQVQAWPEVGVAGITMLKTTILSHNLHHHAYIAGIHQQATDRHLLNPAHHQSTTEVLTSATTTLSKDTQNSDDTINISTTTIIISPISSLERLEIYHTTSSSRSLSDSNRIL